MRIITEANISRTRWIYALALTFVALTLIGSSVLVHRAISHDRGDVRIVNLAGRQRMLSQRMAKCVLALSSPKMEQSAAPYLHELRETYNRWVLVHNGLQKGDAQLDLDASLNSEKIKQLFSQIAPYYNRMALQSSIVLQAADSQRLSQSVLQNAATSILTDEPHFLSLMDQITFQYDAEATERVQVLQRTVLLLLLCGLLALYFMYLLVFRPSIKQLTILLTAHREKSAALQATNEKLQCSLEESRSLADIAKAAENTKSQFLARMSHEIRTPLNAVIGMCYLALKTDLTPRQEDYLNKIRISSNILLRIINDILDYSKIEAGMLTAEKSAFDLEAVLGDVVSITSLGAAEKQIEFLLSVENTVPTNLIGDPLRLEQVLFNLVGNAVKFTDFGEIILDVHAENITEKTAKIKFSVRDTGIGISEMQKQKLFAPFAQADETISRRYGGTGLGLSISYRLVELMGGALEIKSEPGKGSEFFFTLDFPLSQSAVARASQRTASFDGMRVLVVDDNPTSRHIICDMLSDMHFAVSTAESGLDALRQIEEERRHFSLILLDWKMPEMDGIECAQKIRSMGLLSPPAIIIITAYGRDEVRVNAENIGVDGFLLKPVNRSVLFDTIVDTLGIAHIQKNSGHMPSEASLLPTGLHGLRALLAEDNEINQQVAREILEEVGLVVDIANDGEEAVKKIESEKYAVVLMDVQMPGMDGLEATRRIRKQKKFESLPIIAMTANAMAEDRAVCLAAGMNDHVGKPVVPEKLFHVLMEWVKAEDQSAEDVQDPYEAKNKFSEKHINKEDRTDILDVKLGLTRVRGNKTLYYRLLKDFTIKYKKFSSEVQKLVAENDLAGARRLVHTLMGASGNIGAMDLYDTARELDGYMRKDVLSSPRLLIESCQTLINMLNVHIQKILPEKAGGDQSENLPKESIKIETWSKFYAMQEALSHNDTHALVLFDSVSESLRSIDPEKAAALGDALRKFDFKEAKDAADALLSHVKELERADVS